MLPLVPRNITPRQVNLSTKLAYHCEMSSNHAAYSALTYGHMSKWTYLIVITPNISHLLIDDALHSDLPALTGQPPLMNWNVLCLPYLLVWVD